MNNIKSLMHTKLEFLYTKGLLDLNGYVFNNEDLKKLVDARSIVIVDSSISHQVRTDLVKIKRQQIKI
jgi:hypothetical protein